MKLAFINGSPKVKQSASGCIIEDFQSFINKEHTVYHYIINKPDVSNEIMDEILSCDSLIFAFPLYVDAIPSHLLKVLVNLSSYAISHGKKNILIYAIVNCGFYEGKQNEIAIEIMKHWAEKTGFIWGQGLGIGAGGMLHSIKNVPYGRGPKKNLGKAFTKLADSVNNQNGKESIFVNINFPRFAYIKAAHMGWRASAKSNGLKIKDLHKGT
jgi:multimeric flavodoxin WrbA